MNEPVVDLIQVSKSFGDNSAVQEISFSLLDGEILSLLGPSGSGKTTTIRLIAGFETLDQGEVRINGVTVSGHKVHTPPENRNIGMVVQEFALFPHLTVNQNVSFGLSRQFHKPERDARVSEMLDLVRLSGYGDNYPHELSGGEQQRVALARTLAPRPVTVLLDEPFSNIDPTMRGQVRHEIEAILRETNTSVILITHDREEAFSIADRVAVLEGGHLHQINTPEVLFHTPATKFVATMTTVCGFLDGTVDNRFVRTEIGDLPWIPVDSGPVSSVISDHPDPVCETISSGNAHILNSHVHPGTLPDNTQISVLIRANDISAIPKSDGPFVVKSREFRGDHTILDIELPSGTTLKSKQGISDIEVGSRVILVPATDQPFVVFHS